jgi:hypothetical protein
VTPFACTSLQAQDRKSNKCTSDKEETPFQPPAGDKFSEAAAAAAPRGTPATTIESLIPHMMCCCRGGGVRPLVRGMLLCNVKECFKRIS